MSASDDKPEVRAEACANCPHCDDLVMLREASWRTRNVVAGAIKGEVVCPKCGGSFDVEEPLPA